MCFTVSLHHCFPKSSHRHTGDQMGVGGDYGEGRAVERMMFCIYMFVLCMKNAILADELNPLEL